jgi:hypothetical protein
MKVKRILANVKARNIGDAKRFYEKVLGLEQLMIWGGLPPTVPMPNQLLPSPLQLPPIATDDDGGGGTDSLISMYVEAGTYSILANSALVTAETGSYILTTTFTTVTPIGLTVGSPLPGRVERNAETSYEVPVVSRSQIYGQHHRPDRQCDGTCIGREQRSSESQRLSQRLPRYGRRHTAHHQS